MQRLIALSAALLLSAPALAQDESQAGGERVNQLIVFGDDPCPASENPDEITVCARKDESERFRIPEPFRGAASPQNEAWNNKVLAYETVGATGTLSCSPVGAGGSLGCTKQLIDAAYAEKRGDSSIRFGELIAKEREKRLSTIDAEAAATQTRVEEIEKQYEERRKAEEAQGPASGSAPAIPPTP